MHSECELILSSGTISSTNVAPTASDSTFGTIINKSYSGNLTANDVNGDNLTYRLVSNGSMGSAAIAQNGTFTYTPATNQVGTAALHDTTQHNTT